MLWKVITLLLLADDRRSAVASSEPGCLLP